jgi:hypothetical protein
MIWEDKLCTVHYANMEDIEYYTASELKPYKETNMEESKDCPKAPILSNRYDYAEGKCGYVIPPGYEFYCIREGFQTEIILKPKKPTCPKTYKECCDVLGVSPYYNLRYYTYEKGFDCFIPNDDKRCQLEDKLNTLGKVIICRDVYWKIYGEQMGLGKSWEPDLENEELYCIQNYNKQIVIGRTNTAFNKILIFPTEKMADTFYENFKDLIEQCKELL